MISDNLGADGEPSVCTEVASLFGGCLALWITVTTSSARVAYYPEGALDADRRGDQDAAMMFREKADRYAP